MSIQLADGTTLDDFIKYVQDATRRPNGEVIPIYVDPIGLQEAERSMTSPLQGVHFEGVALRTSLRLCLRQLDLAYVVRDGLLLITSQENEDALVISPNDDPYQIVGHCLLAIFAAVLGGLAAPLVCDRRVAEAAPRIKSESLQQLPCPSRLDPPHQRPVIAPAHPALAIGLMCASELVGVERHAEARPGRNGHFPALDREFRSLDDVGSVDQPRDNGCRWPA